MRQYAALRKGQHRTSQSMAPKSGHASPLMQFMLYDIYALCFIIAATLSIVCFHHLEYRITR